MCAASIAGTLALGSVAGSVITGAVLLTKAKKANASEAAMRKEAKEIKEEATLYQKIAELVDKPKPNSKETKMLEILRKEGSGENRFDS